MLRRLLLPLLIAAPLALPCAAGAAVTVGSPLAISAENPASCGGSTLTNTALAQGTLAAPYDGVVTRWRISIGTGGGSYGYKLRIVRPIGGQFTGAGTGPSQTAPAAGVNVISLPAPLPVKAGDLIGVDCPSGAPAPFNFSLFGSTYSYFSGFLADGGLSIPSSVGSDEALVNADVVGAPTLSSVSPSGGPASGGTVVTIAGTHVGDATAITFGGTPGTAITPQGDGSVTVVAPAHAAGDVDIQLTNAAGATAVVAADRFHYAAPPPPAPPPPAPNCTLKADPRVRVRRPKGGRRVSLGVLSVQVSCDEQAAVSLAGTLSEKVRVGRRKRSRTFALGPVAGAAAAHVAATLQLPLPPRALADLRGGAAQRVALTLTARAAGGSAPGTASAVVPRLRGF